MTGNYLMARQDHGQIIQLLRCIINEFIYCSLYS